MADMNTTVNRKNPLKSYRDNIRKNFKLKYYINYIIVTAALILFIVMQSAGIMSRSLADLLSQIGYSIILAVSLNIVV